MYSSRNFPEEKKQYYNTLNTQLVERVSHEKAKKVNDQEQQKRHFESWETFWGRPGAGAPKEGRVQKENLMKLLHYPETNKVDQIAHKMILIINVLSTYYLLLSFSWILL